MNNKLKNKLQKFMKELASDTFLPHLNNLTKYEEMELNTIWDKLNELTADKICSICGEKINPDTDCSISRCPNWIIEDFKPIAEAHQNCCDKKKKYK